MAHLMQGGQLPDCVSSLNTSEGVEGAETLGYFDGESVDGSGGQPEALLFLCIGTNMLVRECMSSKNIFMMLGK